MKRFFLTLLRFLIIGAISLQPLYAQMMMLKERPYAVDFSFSKNFKDSILMNDDQQRILHSDQQIGGSVGLSYYSPETLYLRFKGSYIGGQGHNIDFSNKGQFYKGVVDQNTMHLDLDLGKDISPFKDWRIIPYVGGGIHDNAALYRFLDAKNNTLEASIEDRQYIIYGGMLIYVDISRSLSMALDGRVGEVVSRNDTDVNPNNPHNIGMHKIRYDMNYRISLPIEAKMEKTNGFRFEPYYEGYARKGASISEEAISRDVGANLGYFFNF